MHFTTSQKNTRRNTEIADAKTRSQFRKVQFQVGWNRKTRLQLFRLQINESEQLFRFWQLAE